MLEFEIPSDIDDLLSSGSDDNKFVVKRIYKLNEIGKALEQAKQALDNDVQDIQEHFGTYFSIIKHGEKNEPMTLKKTALLLTLLTERLISLLEGEFFKRSQVESDTRKKYLNCTKMIFFLSYEFLKMGNSIFGDKTMFIKTKDNSANWDENRLRILRQFYSFLKFPIAKLFDKAITDNNFIDMFTDICYRILSTNNTISKDLEELVFHILGVSFKKHLHVASYQSQILNILSQHENSVVPIVNGILTMYQDYDLKSIFSMLVPEFINILNIQSKNAALAKNFSTFIIEISKKSPSLLIPVLDQLHQNMLNMDPYCIRNSILEAISFVIMDMNVEMTDKAKQELLNDMMESIGDGNSYVRSKVFQLLLAINEKTHFITQNMVKVLALAETHLEDKSALVRKNALHLIIEMIRSNKSEKKLNIPDLEVELKLETEKLENIMNVLYGMNSDLGEMDAFLTKEMKSILEEENDEFTDLEMNFEQLKEQMMKAYSNKRYKSVVNVVRLIFVKNGDQEEIDKMFPEEKEVLHKLKCLNMVLSACTPPEMQTEIDTIQERKLEVENTIKYVSLITVCVDKAKKMLMSTTNSDVLASVEFFKTGYVFSMSIVESGLREMLILLGKSDATITSFCIQAFVEVLFRNKPQESTEKYYLETCFNMFKLLNDITIGEILSMEILIKELMITEIDKELITMLFRIFTKKIENISDNESRMALELLRMIAKAKASALEDNIDLFQNVLKTTNDPRVYSTCLEILLYLCSFRKKFSYKIDSELMEIVRETFKKFFFRKNSICFDSVAKSVFDLIYNVVEYPGKVAKSIVLNLYQNLTEISNLVKEKGSSQIRSSQQIEEGVLLDLPTWVTTRFIHVIGVISMKQVIFLDTAVFEKLKTDAEDRLLRDKNELDNRNEDVRSGGRNRRRKSKSDADNDNENLSEKQKIMDEIDESITRVCNMELLYHKDAILGKFIPLVLNICKRKDESTKHKDLRSAAILTLTNLMCVSDSFCEQNFSLAMKILENIDDPSVKMNIIIGFSDWIFQFSNVSEPWTKFIYGMLKSENDSVRLTTVTILTYLIRQEMVRVRAQISDLALCLVDRDERIKDIARQFFVELSEKSQTLESVMPEIISNLNDETQRLPQFQYEEIMTRLFSLITKERGTMVMVEKLCSRLKESRTDGLAQKCAHCLTLLTHSEKSIRRLIEYCKEFKGKFQIPEVYNAFQHVINKSTKTSGKDLKVVMDELAAKVEECLKMDSDGEERPQTQSQKPAKVAKKKNQKRGKPRRSFSDEEEVENVKPALRTRPKRNVKNVSESE